MCWQGREVRQQHPGVPGGTVPADAKPTEGGHVRDAVVSRIRALIEGCDALAESLPDGAFIETLPARSNSIGAQFWCVVGARESYAKAIESDAWVGFSCSLDGSDIGNQPRVAEALHRSASAFERAIAGVDWTPARDEMLLALLEHEAQHQGQLIRYVYALDYAFPASWVERWALGE